MLKLLILLYIYYTEQRSLTIFNTNVAHIIINTYFHIQTNKSAVKKKKC